MGGNANADDLLWVLAWPTCCLPAARIRAPVAHSLSYELLHLNGKVVSHQVSHGKNMSAKVYLNRRWIWAWWLIKIRKVGNDRAAAGAEAATAGHRRGAGAGHRLALSARRPGPRRVRPIPAATTWPRWAVPIPSSPITRFARLHQASLGLPRALNNAAIAALIAAASAGKALVDDDCAKKAVAELTRD